MEKRIRVWKLAGGFFAGMALFTLLSRAAYQYGTAVVETAAPNGGVVTHEVYVTGAVTYNQELAVTTIAGLRVGRVLVDVGQQVAQGEVLFTLDAAHLQQVIDTQKQELEKQRLSVQDAWSQNNAAQKQRQEQQTQAQENYDRAVDRALDRVEQTQAALGQAENALEDYRNGQSGQQAQQQALESQCRQAQGQLDQAAEALRQVRSQIESAVAQALAEAAENAEGGTLTPQEQEEIRQTVHQDHAAALAQAETAHQQAEQALAEAQAALEALLSAPTEPASEEALQAAVQQAQADYEAALTDLDDAQANYGQAVRSAQLPQASSHAPQIGQITYDQMAQELEQLEALQAAGGQVTSPVEGVVTRCLISAGEKTGDTTAVALADLSRGLRFTAQADKEQSLYIGVGDLVTLRSGATGKTYEDLAVTAVSALSGGGSDVTVQLEANTLPLGATAQLSRTQRSQAYSCCVPIGALRLDERNEPYVLVVRTVQTVLGAQTRAQKVRVTVLERGQTTAALATGAVSSQDRVIVSSDRPVDDGSRVRIS